MSYCLGVDLGTSSLKALVLDMQGKEMIAFAKKDLTTRAPRVNFAEQDPEDWWEAAKSTIRELAVLRPEALEKISAISFSGQMHGLVLLDRDFQVIRPAIIWADQRANRQVEEVNRLFGEDRYRKMCGNRLASGTTLASLLWVKENEPENFAKVLMVLLPKDYVRYRMTGGIGTDISDAAGSFAFQNTERLWAEDLLGFLQLPTEVFPKVNSSFAPAGSVSRGLAKETGLRSGVPVYFGGADQPLQAIGNAVISEGLVLSNIGTGSQISTVLNRPFYDQLFRTYTFCHALSDKWYMMGASLNGGNALDWLKRNVLSDCDYPQLLREAAEVDAGSNGLIFVPYLLGERSPHFNPYAEGMFFGLRASHGRSHLARAVMEGIVFALKDSLATMESMGISSDLVVASGGTVRHNLWLQIQADVYEKRVVTSVLPEQACMGAAVVASVGAGEFRTVADACKAVVKHNPTVFEPKEKSLRAYQKNYEIFKELYARNLSLFRGQGN